LSDVLEEPLATLDFAGHAGLLWLYAERWAQRHKPAWQPVGLGAEYLEAVWSDLGRDLRELQRIESTKSPIREDGA
jgi:hypothetical protein